MADPQLIEVPPLVLLSTNSYGRAGSGVWDPNSSTTATIETGHIHVKSGVGVTFASANFGFYGDRDGEVGIVGNLSRTFEVDWACSGGSQTNAVAMAFSVQVREPFPDDSDEHRVMLELPAEAGDMRQTYPAPAGAPGWQYPYVAIGTSGTWQFEFSSYNGLDEQSFPDPCEFEDIPYPFGYVSVEISMWAVTAANWAYFTDMEWDFVIRPTGTPLPWVTPPPAAGNFWTGFVRTKETDLS